MQHIEVHAMPDVPDGGAWVAIDGLASYYTDEYGTAYRVGDPIALIRWGNQRPVANLVEALVADHFGDSGPYAIQEAKPHTHAIVINYDDAPGRKAYCVYGTYESWEDGFEALDLLVRELIEDPEGESHTEDELVAEVRHVRDTGDGSAFGFHVYVVDYNPPVNDNA